LQINKKILAPSRQSAFRLQTLCADFVRQWFALTTRQSAALWAPQPKAPGAILADRAESSPIMPIVCLQWHRTRPPADLFTLGPVDI